MIQKPGFIKQISLVNEVGDEKSTKLTHTKTLIPRLAKGLREVKND